MKRLIAYSSVSHLGFCMLGLFALNSLGVQGALVQMVSHGLSTGGLFAIVGMIYERYHTREIAELGGIARRTPRLAAMAVLFALASIGLPGLSGFVGELMVLLGMFQRGWSETGPAAWQFRVIAVAAVSGVVLGAWYMLWLVERVLFGPLREPTGGGHHVHVPDLSLREGLALAPLVVWMFWLGLAPDYFLRRTEKASQQAIVNLPASNSQPADLASAHPFDSRP
jgi:NADH-quinone oxidoreductase subunit M